MVLSQQRKCKGEAVELTIQETSLEAYDVLQPELGKRQRQVYEIIEKHQEVSINDISRIMQKQTHNITGRLMELRNKGLVFNSGHKTDRITNRRVLKWSVVR